MKRALVVACIGMMVWLSGSLPCNAQSSSTVPDHIERLLKEGKFDEARTEIEKFRRKSPDNARAVFYLARLEKDTNKAIDLF